jgi:hypothetical protein
MSRIPTYVSKQFGGVRKFRAYHRLALQDARRALERARRGCAFTPDTVAVHRACDALAEAIKQCRPTAWEGRRSHLRVEPL